MNAQKKSPKNAPAPVPAEVLDEREKLADEASDRLQKALDLVESLVRVCGDRPGLRGYLAGALEAAQNRAMVAAVELVDMQKQLEST